MKTFLYKIYAWIMLLNAVKPSYHEKVEYYLKAVASLSVVLWILDSVGLWFAENTLFYRGMLIAIAINMYYGWRWHRRLGDFKSKIFWTKNLQMWGIIISVYPLLEILYRMAGENAIAEVFKLMVQVSTILYPGSKALKNAYLFSDKKYPPSFIMDKLYNFEKSGNIHDLYGKDDNNLNAG
ncbi:MAG: hypothetical protein V4581_02650 [Bacteroidota bacterium]